MMAICVAAALPSFATSLAHRWSFNGYLDDSVGTAHAITKPAADQRFIVCQGTVNINEGASIKVGGNTSNICNYIGVDRNNATAVVNIDGGTLWCTTEGTSAEGGITGPVRSLDVKGCLVSVSQDGTRASIQRGGLTVFVR